MVSQRAILLRLPDLKKLSKKVRKPKTNAIPLFAQLRVFLGECALPSTKRDGSTGYGGGRGYKAAGDGGPRWILT